MRLRTLLTAYAAAVSLGVFLGLLLVSQATRVDSGDGARGMYWGSVGLESTPGHAVRVWACSDGDPAWWEVNCPIRDSHPQLIVWGELIEDHGTRYRATSGMLISSYGVAS